MENEGKYFQFPSFLLRDFMTDKERVLNNIIRYGLYCYSEKLDCVKSAVAKQLMYCYYSNRSKLTNYLLQALERYVNDDIITLDDCYHGFVGNCKEFNPFTEIEEILNIFDTDIKFKDQAFEWYKIRQAYNFIGVNGNYENCLIVGKKIQDSIPSGEPMPMMNKSQLFEFRDNDKTERDLIQFAVNIGIRSIIGTKSYCKTNKEMIVCRAFGYNTIKHLPTSLPQLLCKYSNRYHIDKVLQLLELNNWNLIFYSHNMRGMYIGLKDKISIESLIEIAETKKLKNRIEKLKNEKQIARERVLQQLNKGQQLKRNSKQLQQQRM